MQSGCHDLLVKKTCLPMCLLVDFARSSTKIRPPQSTYTNTEQGYYPPIYCGLHP